MSLLSIPDIAIAPPPRQAPHTGSTAGATAFADVVWREAGAPQDDLRTATRRDRSARDHASAESIPQSGGMTTPAAAAAAVAGEDAAHRTGQPGQTDPGGVAEPQTATLSGAASAIPGQTEAAPVGATAPPDGRAATTDAVNAATGATPAEVVVATAGTAAAPHASADPAPHASADPAPHASADPATPAGQATPTTTTAGQAAPAEVDATVSAPIAPSAVVPGADTGSGDTTRQHARDATGARSARVGPHLTGAGIGIPAQTTAVMPSSPASPAPDATAPAAAGTLTAVSDSILPTMHHRLGDATPVTAIATAPTDAHTTTASAAPAPRQVLLPQLSAPVLSLARAADGEHSVTLTVAPESLGPVTVRAHIAAGVIHLELHAPSDAGREALRAILTDLRRDLAVAAPGSSLAMSSDGSSSGPPADGRQSAGGRAHAGTDVRDGGDAPEHRVAPPAHQPTLTHQLPPHGGLDLYA